MVKEYKQKRKKFIEDFNFNLNKFTSNLPTVIKQNKNTTINSTSWFDINKIKAVKTTNNLKINTEFPNEVISCQKIKMILSKNQKLILNKWFTSYTDMYNKTLNYIRINCSTFKNQSRKKKTKRY